MLLSGCGASSGGDEFIDAGDGGSADRYQRLVDAVLADGKLTRPETEQAIEAQIACYVDHGLAGEYGYDLDIYPWIIGGAYGLAMDNPNNQATGERPLADTALGKALAACDSIFEPVERVAFSTVDWDVSRQRQYEGRVRCLASTVPEFAKSIEPVLSKLDVAEASVKIYDLVQYDTTMSREDRRAAIYCLTYSSAQRKFFGGGLEEHQEELRAGTQ